MVVSSRTLNLAVLVLMVFAAISFAVSIVNPATMSAQTLEPTVVQESDVSDDSTLNRTDTESETAKTEEVKTGDATDDVEIQRQLIELRRELLNDRADTIEWWLAAVAIFVTLFGVGAAIAGYVSFNRFREIETEARLNVGKAAEHLREAERLVGEIREYRRQSEVYLQVIRQGTTEDIKDPIKDREIGKAAMEVQQNPNASLIDREIAVAYSLQRKGRVKEALEKWRSIATIAEGVDDEIVARAWFAIAYLLQEGIDGEK